MNPALILIIIIICVAVWFLAAFLYKPIGRLFYRIGKDAVDEMMEADEAEEDDEEKEKKE